MEIESAGVQSSADEENLQGPKQPLDLNDLQFSEGISEDKPSGPNQRKRKRNDAFDKESNEISKKRASVAVDSDENGEENEKENNDLEDEEEQDKDVEVEYGMERARVLLHIRCYKEAFPNVCDAMLDGINLSSTKMSLATAQKLLDEIKMQVCFKNGLKITGKTIAEAGLGLLESGLLAFTDLQVSGLAYATANDPDFVDIANELALEYIPLVYTKPQYRMGLHILKNAFMLDKINRAAGNSQFLSNINNSQQQSSQDIMVGVTDTNNNVSMNTVTTNISLQ